MELSFNSKEIRDICELEEIAIEAFGLEITRNLQVVIAELEAAGTIYELINGSLEICDEFAKVSLNEIELVFVPQQASESIDWHNINRIKILRLGNTKA